MQTTDPLPAGAVQENNPVQEDNTVAFVAYLTIIGFIVAIVMHGNNKTKLGAFHLRQVLGLFLTGFVGGVVLMFIPVIGWVLSPFWWLGIVVLAVMGLISALNRQMKPLPILGSQYQEWFANAFN